MSQAISNWFKEKIVDKVTIAIQANGGVLDNTFVSGDQEANTIKFPIANGTPSLYKLTGAIEPVPVSSPGLSTVQIAMDDYEGTEFWRTQDAYKAGPNEQATLAELLPVRFQPGESYHVISRGDVDALSYLSHAINGVSHFDFVGISTWCIARPDLEQIAAWLDAGRIEHFELYAGEIFPSQYGDEHEQMLKMVADYDCKLVIAKNHSKVTLASNYADDYHLVVEGSANVNTNPRIEQAAIHCGRELFDFYREFFNGLRSIDRSTKSH